MEWLFYYVHDWSQPSNTWACTCGSFLHTPLLIITVLLSDILRQSGSAAKIPLPWHSAGFLHTSHCFMWNGKNKNTPDTSWTHLSDCLSSHSIIIRFVTILILYCGFVVWLLRSGGFFFFSSSVFLSDWCDVFFYMSSFSHFSFTLLFSNRSKTHFQINYLSV